MRIVIAGGTGFLGSPLAEVYAEESHDVRVLTRGLPPGESRHDPGTGVPGVTRVGWRPDARSGPWAAAVDGADAVINLAGESIGAKRWTPQRKAALRESRTIPTRSLVAAIASVTQPPRVFISGSAVGYYGPSGDDVKTEESPAGADLLAHICEDWEAEALRAAPDTRVVLLRTGVGTRAVRRGAREDDPAVPPVRRWSHGLRPPVPVVDSPHRLDRDGAVDRRDAVSIGAGQRDGARAGHQPRIRASPRSSAAPAVTPPRAGVRAESAAR